MICFAENRILIGTICLWNFEITKAQVEIGYELSPMYQGKGIMHEAAEKIIEYAFETMQAKTVTALTTPNNIPSKKLLERCGFKADLLHKYVNIEEAEGQAVYFLLAP